MGANVEVAENNPEVPIEPTQDEGAVMSEEIEGGVAEEEQNEVNKVGESQEEIGTDEDEVNEDVAETKSVVTDEQLQEEATEVRKDEVGKEEERNVDNSEATVDTAADGTEEGKAEEKGE